ncbi:Pet127-domain-containing protein [Microthyrium microscopicum]|uniref:Pet127-domain-containing protein n=1 Tax=Microthyrium microscopicum TaxID=703497 RepID=A0A6A6U4G6_9PEZI|nr:Pet127-domain-containing protein [Microthyrium microscopicum]
MNLRNTQYLFSRTVYRHGIIRCRHFSAPRRISSKLPTSIRYYISQSTTSSSSSHLPSSISNDVVLSSDSAAKSPKAVSRENPVTDLYKFCTLNRIIVDFQAWNPNDGHLGPFLGKIFLTLEDGTRKTFIADRPQNTKKEAKYLACGLAWKWLKNPAGLAYNYKPTTIKIERVQATDGRPLVHGVRIKGIRTEQTGALPEMVRRAQPSVTQSPSKLPKKQQVAREFTRHELNSQPELALPLEPPGIKQLPVSLARKDGRADDPTRWEFKNVLIVESELEDVGGGTSSEKVEPPRLHHGLDRVIFNPGVSTFQCPRTGVYNFDPDIQMIPSVDDFNFDALPPYHKPSEDPTLPSLLEKYPSRKFFGSTSTMTQMLQQLHYFISDWRPVNVKFTSKEFEAVKSDPTDTQKVPTSIMLKYLGNGCYCVDPDMTKSGGAQELMMAGHLLEKLLTVPKEEFRTFLKSNKQEGDAGKKQKQQEVEQQAFNFTGIGKFLVRSQLDAMDPRLKVNGGGGYFDLKTRAALAVRMDPQERYKEMRGYQIKTLQGDVESYEREMYDLSRTMLFKYSAQARLGRMDGIFIAFHNLAQLFGFRYLSLPDIDTIIHGQPELVGPQEFQYSMQMLQEILERVTEENPEKDLWVHFFTLPTSYRGLENSSKGSAPASLQVFAETVTPELLQEAQELREIAKEDSPKAAAGDVDSDGVAPSLLAREVKEIKEMTSHLYETCRAAFKHLQESSVTSSTAITPEPFAPLYRYYQPLKRKTEQVIVDVHTSGTGQEFDPVISDAQEALTMVKKILNTVSKPMLVLIAQKAAEIQGETKKGIGSFHWNHQPANLAMYEFDVRNYVNGQTVRRPNNLESSEKWTVQYAEKPPGEDRVKLDQYREMLRRKFIRDTDEEKDKLYDGSFLRMLRSLALRGSEYFTKFQSRMSAHSRPIVFTPYHRTVVSKGGERSKFDPNAAIKGRRRNMPLSTKSLLKPDLRRELLQKLRSDKKAAKEVQSAKAKRRAIEDAKVSPRKQRKARKATLKFPVKAVDGAAKNKGATVTIPELEVATPAASESKPEPAKPEDVVQKKRVVQGKRPPSPRNAVSDEEIANILSPEYIK